jgi:hypothetical protein
MPVSRRLLSSAQLSLVSSQRAVHLVAHGFIVSWCYVGAAGVLEIDASSSVGDLAPAAKQSASSSSTTGARVAGPSSTSEPLEQRSTTQLHAKPMAAASLAIFEAMRAGSSGVESCVACGESVLSTVWGIASANNRCAQLGYVDWKGSDLSCAQHGMLEKLILIELPLALVPFVRWSVLPAAAVRVGCTSPV